MELLILLIDSVAAFTQCEVTEVPQQSDASRPHHQVTAAPPQEEETTQHQCTVPGLTHTRTHARTNTQKAAAYRVQ